MGGTTTHRFFDSSAPIVQVPELVPPLVRTLALALTAFPSAFVLLAHQTRSKSTDALLWALLSEERIEATIVPFERHHPIYRHPDINLFELRLRTQLEEHEKGR